MTRFPEGHSRPESLPPGGLVDILKSWENGGGHWRIVARTDGWLTVGLLRGEQEISRVSGARTTVLATYLAGRERSDQPPPGVG